MAVEHMAAENNKPTAIKTKTDEYVLKLFWTLSEGQDNARIKASNELVKHLTKKQENSEESKTDELCPTLVYTLERLIKGLSSGRKWSRLGFSLALTQILRNLDVPVKQVLDLTEKHLHFSSHDQKQECGGLMLGQAFVYLSLIQSHRLIKGDGKEYGGEVIKTLFKLCKEKMYLQSICSQGLTLLIQQASSKIFKKRLLPCLQDELDKGWKGCTINRLLIALVSTIHHEDCMEEILEEHWTNPIVSKKSFTFIVEVLRNCSVESKVYVQVCELLAKLSETSVDRTWHGVGARILEGNQQQKQIAGCLLNKLLIVTSSPEQIEELLNRKVREFLILFPGSIHVKQTKDEILKAIVDKIRTCQDVDIEMALVRSLLRDPGGPAIDRSTKSQTLSQAIKSLSEEGFDQYFKMVQQIFMEETVEGFTPTECLRIKKKAVFLLRQKTLMGEHQTALIKQLFVQGYFNVITPSTKILYCKNKVSYDEEELKMMQNGYLNCVANFHSGSMVQSTHRKKYLQLLIEVFNYAQELMSNTKIVTTKKKLSQKERDAWNKVVVVVKEITDKVEDKKKVEDDAFLFLFIHFALQILTDSTKLDLSLLEDVQSCYKKAFLKKKPGDKNTSDEPEWIEVMTEVLLNMMSHSYQLARVMSSTAFKLLVDHVTPETVEQIITVMFSKMGDDAVNFIDDEDKNDDDDDDEEGEEDESGDDDDDDDDSDEESSEETDEDEEDTKPNGKKVEKPSKKLKIDVKDSKEKSLKSENAVKKKSGKREDDDDEMEEAEDFNEGFRQTVKAALGVAAADSDDEESDSDLNDSDMEKMDDKLAEAFRSMRKTSRKKVGVEAEKQFIAFKTRVVDLIQILVKSDIQAQIAVSLVLPLLRIMDKSNLKDGQRELHVKTKKSFDILYNQKHMKGASEVDKDWLFKTLQEIVQFSTKATDLVLVKEISNACLYIMKLLLLDDETLNPTKRDDTKSKKKKSENYREKVVDFLKENLSFFLYNKK
ncbi:myb-binding protein 1A-like protein isoform X2 [Patella vulgata]|nr:myb-binding protein 1A-like protein isoform X2 [Patella vulgata]